MKIDPILSRHLSAFGAKGGNNRTNNLTPKQRVKAAKKAVNTRWETQRKTNENTKRTNEK
jgi:hypothetical protein